jgi:hypothetical protein
MAIYNEFDTRPTQSVENGDIGMSAKTKNILDPIRLELGDESFGTGHP